MQRDADGLTELPRRMKQIYERVSTDGAAIIDDIIALSTDDVEFASPSDRNSGHANLRRAWERAFRIYKEFQISDVACVGDDRAFMLRFTVHARFFAGPRFHVPMMADCRGRDGRLCYINDYFDPMGTLLGPIPALKAVYRWCFRQLIA